MDFSLRINKRLMRGFIQAHYRDEHLVSAIDRCRAGTLLFYSCDCFVGLVTKGAVVGQCNSSHSHEHLREARMLPHAGMAEHAYLKLATFDEERQRLLLPMLKAELRRRARLIQLPITNRELVAR